MQIRLADGHLHQFRSLLRKHRCGKWTGWLNGMDTIPANQLCVAAKRIKGSELLIVATNLGEGVSGLNLYRKRWGIECLFADAKIRGLNIEDTHITDPDKLANLLIVVALAVTWAHRCATLAMGRSAIRRKAHGRREKSCVARHMWNGPRCKGFFSRFHTWERCGHMSGLSARPMTAGLDEVRDAGG